MGVKKNIAELGTRERILAVTTEMLATRCLHSLSIRDIAEAARSNSALISYHFGGKEKLHEEIIAWQFELYMTQVVSTFRTEGDIRANLRQAARSLADFHRTNPYWLTFYFRELTNPSACYTKIILPAIAEASRKAVAMVQAGIDQEIFKPDTNPRYVVQSFIGMVNYCFMTSRLQKDLNIAPAQNIADYLNFVTEMLLRQIEVTP